MTIEKLLSETYEKYSEISPTFVTTEWFNFKPASDKKITDFEAQLGCELSPDLKVFFQKCGYHWICEGNYTFSGFKQIKDNWQMLEKSLREYMHEEEWVKRAQPNDKLKPGYWNTKWVPFAIDGCGNLICIDHDPGKKGVFGQLIFMELQDGQGPYVDEKRTLSDFLGEQLQLMKDGKFEVEEGGHFEISQYF